MQNYIFSSDLERAQSKILKPYVEEEIWIFFKKKNSVVWVMMMYSKEFKL